MAILEERGLFWWADQRVPENQFAPDSCLVGALTIKDDGQARLELDGYFPGEHGPMTPMMRQGQRIPKNIQGVLKTSNRGVLLMGITGNGGRFSTSGMSFECYGAERCLLTNAASELPSKDAFKKLVIPLAGFEEWLRLAAIDVAHSRRITTIKYKRRKDAIYRTANGRLSIGFDGVADSSGVVFGTAFSLKEVANALLQFKKSITSKELVTQYQLFEDLLLLLTGSDHTLDWPWIELGKAVRCRLYFPKLATKESLPPPKAHECCTSFVQLRDCFGDIWSNWIKKREAYGPGFYLYLGTRRGVRLYIENRFANLVFGLEAFSRRSNLPATSTKLDDKIKRIIDGVNSEKDKRWVAGILERSKEPSLAQRLYSVLSKVPLGLEEARLRSFCEVCSRLRNDVSHFGGQRHEGQSYNDFILDLESKAQSLSALYQALLLYEIGVNAEVIRAWLFDGFNSAPIKYQFVSAGLLERAALDSKQ